MTEQEFEEMMQEITNDPWYIAHQEELKQETMQALDHLTDEEIAELCQKYFTSYSNPAKVVSDWAS